MSEQITDTVLNSITDNLADSFFESGASSKNVLTQDDKTKTTEKEPVVEKKEDKKESKLNEFASDALLSAEEILGDRLSFDDIKPTKVELGKEGEKITDKKEETPLDFDFLIENKVLSPYEDDAPIKNTKELGELIKANKTAWVEDAKIEAVKELQDNLPEEVKFVLEYAKNGGDDLKSVFKLLSQTEEFKDYNIEKPEGQKAVVRAYYATQGWSEDEIEDELVNLVENKRLESSSQKLKPKLDKFNQDQLLVKKEQQEAMRGEQEKARKFFTDNVINTLKTGKLGDLKISKDEQQDIFNALVKESYQSFNGPTNRLGALLDRIQFAKPDYALLAKLTMYASDPDAFEKKIRDGITTEVTANQIKKIKTEQAKAAIGSIHSVENDTKKLPRLNSNFL